MKERYAISGNRGFIGSALTEKLADYGHDVTRIDRNGVVRGEQDYIIDLAAHGNNYQNRKEYESIYNANITRLIKMLSTSEDYKGFIVTSSTALQLPTETFYTASKRAAESLVKAYVNEFGAPIAIVRPASVTGVGEQPQRLISTLIRSCMYGEEMNFVGEPVHDFIDIDDFLNGLLTVAHNADTHKGEIFNISSGIGYSNEQVKDIVERVTGNKANIKRVDSLRSYDSKDWVVDNSKLKELGWKPKKTLEDSIKEMVSNFK